MGKNRIYLFFFFFRKPLCIFSSNKCGLEGSQRHHNRLVRVSLSYSLATAETPQHRKIGGGMTACSKLKCHIAIPLKNMQVLNAESNKISLVAAQS